ncbi:glycoside hydrolase family 3 protein [Thalassotalea crassostreae]|uniref:glycoside hydrolase family 3 protein n=1 Tax=Thalassotalea crassostreae TaxID=1763536 RepID=UPI00083879EE|nr:exo 1,3/1,4-beta-D-glucan glucohydrolase [Thalassotalea crassostreae]
MKNTTLSVHNHGKSIASILVASAISISLFSCSENKQDIWPKLDIEVKTDAKIEAQISEILATMTVQQKVAQMIQPEIRDITIEDMRKYGFGSYLNGGGAFPNDNKHASVDDWVMLAEKMYQASIDSSIDGSSIPTMWGTDAVHGHNNVIGATLFPHNIGLGAANNPQLIEEIAHITATEVMVTGIDWVFAPTVAVVRDDRWGRTYEGYSEDPEIVREYSAAIVKGLQGHANKNFLGDDRVISTIKHFIGDGGTVDGDDQGNNISSEQELFDIHAQGYVGGLKAGSQSVMASFNSWNGEKVHGSKYLLTDVLKTKMGFDGFVVGDWNGHGQVAGCSNESCPKAINAGLDIFMAPTESWKPLYENTIAQINSGEIPMARVDDAVSRILRVKLRAGLFDKPSPAKREISGKKELIGAAKHRDVARQAVRESLVLLKNNSGLLPLSPSLNILVAGDGADNIGKQSGGWSVTWQGTGNSNADFPGATSIFAGIKNSVEQAGGTATLSVDGSFTDKPDVAIVVFGEEPYAEGNGDISNLDFQRGNKKDARLLNQLKDQDIPVVAVFITGRPMWVNPELNASDAFVVAWLPGTQGEGIAEVLLRTKDDKVNHDFSGKLSFSWPETAIQTDINRFDKDYAPLFEYGYGLTYSDNVLLANNLDETVANDDNNNTELAIFSGKLFNPWEMALKSDAQSIDINSNSQALNGIRYRTADRNVQEDSFQLDFLGTETASFIIQSGNGFPEDLRDYYSADAHLSFDILVQQKPSQSLKLNVVCEQGCNKTVELKPIIDNLEFNQWTNVAINLNCLVNNPEQVSQILSPFALTSNSKATLKFSNITLNKSQSSTAQVQCND